MLAKTRAIGALAMCWMLIGMLVGCRTPTHRNGVDLIPPVSKPVYQVTVADSDEAALLRQELKLKPLRQDGAVLFFVGEDATLGRLQEAGYTPEPVDARLVFSRVVEIPRKGSEETLLKSGVTLLLREKTRWVVQGNLTQLNLLKAQGFTLVMPKDEPRPREIEVVVNRRQDVQRVAELHVDIYSVTETAREKLYTIRGGAFDYQIDALRTNQFNVRVVPQ